MSQEGRNGPGRPPILDESARRCCAFITKQQRETAEKLGDGIASVGIRKALNMASATIQRRSA